MAAAPAFTFWKRTYFFFQRFHSILFVFSFGFSNVIAFVLRETIMIESSFLKDFSDYKIVIFCFLSQSLSFLPISDQPRHTSSFVSPPTRSLMTSTTRWCIWMTRRCCRKSFIAQYIGGVAASHEFELVLTSMRFETLGWGIATLSLTSIIFLVMWKWKNVVLWAILMDFFWWWSRIIRGETRNSCLRGWIIVLIYLLKEIAHVHTHTCMKKIKY